MSKRSRPHKSQAIQATLNLDRVQYPTIPPNRWHDVQVFLLTLIQNHWPNIQPGQKRIAAELGVSVPTVKRYLSMAVEAGLVEVSADSGMGGRHGHWKTNTYTLRYLNRGSPVIPRPGITSDPQSSSSPYGEESHQKNTSCSSGRDELGAPAARQGGTMNRWKEQDEWGGREFGDSDAPLPGSVVQLTPATRLARYFDEQWRVKVLPARPELRGYQASHRGQATSYVKGVMLHDNDLSPGHVEAYMDAFISAVVSDEMDWKAGQMPFQRFISWWGHNFVEDPGIRQAKVAETERLLAGYRAWRAEEDAKKSAGGS